jgi:peptidyl-prolyl cis-trans isomerase SurA
MLGGMVLRLQPATLRAAAVLALFSLALMAGCKQSPVADDAVARVNGKKILAAEVDKYFENQTADSPVPPTAASSLRLSILRELIDNEILMQRAEKLGLLATDDEVDRRLIEIKAPFTEEEFQERLKERKISLEDFRRDLRRTITVDKVINREITSKITVSDADVTEYYNANRAEFNLIEPQYHLAHIWVSTQPNPQVRNLKNDKAQNEAEARKKIQTLLNRLDSGEDFASVAMNYSEDPETSGSGGDLGFTPESALQRTDPATRDAAIRLRPGTYSNVIPVINPATRQVFGYRIVKLVAKEPAGQRELKDPRVQEAIRAQLRERREQLLKAAYYEVARNEARVENHLAQQLLRNPMQK